MLLVELLSYIYDFFFIGGIFTSICLCSCMCSALCNICVYIQRFDSTCIYGSILKHCRIGVVAHQLIFGNRSFQSSTIHAVKEALIFLVSWLLHSLQFLSNFGFSNYEELWLSLLCYSCTYSYITILLHFGTFLMKALVWSGAGTTY